MSLASDNGSRAKPKNSPSSAEPISVRLESGWFGQSEHSFVKFVQENGHFFNQHSHQSKSYLKSESNHLGLSLSIRGGHRPISGLIGRHLSLSSSLSRSLWMYITYEIDAVQDPYYFLAPTKEKTRQIWVQNRKALEKLKNFESSSAA